MNYRLTGLLVALSAMAFVAAPGEARADYTYVTTVNSLSAVPGLGITVTPLSGTIADSLPSTPSVLNFSFTPTGSGSGSQTLTFTETLTGTPGSQTVTITGTFFYVFQAGFVSAGFNPSTETVTGSGYTVPVFSANYTSTASNGLTASLQVSIIPVAVPEPASLAMLGMGIIGVAGFGLRRKMARVA